MSINSYELSRSWFDFCFENPEKIKPNHTSMYFFAIEHCNRLGWKEKFGFPSTMVMEAIGIKSYNTYINTLNDLIDFGFIKLIEKSKNQYSSNIIALSKFNKALNKALDKAFIKHGSKQGESTDQSIDSIIKQINNKQFNKEQINKIKKSCEIFLNDSEKKFNFKKSFLELGVNEQILNDWMEVRKKKKASNTITAYTKFINQVNLSGLTVNECVKICAEKDWRGFEAEWLNNLNNKSNGTTKKQPATTIDDLIEINKKHFGQ